MGTLETRQLSTQQIAANRRNALKSTGPRTVAGKQRSRLNALKHGLNAQSFRKAMPGLGEDPREYERMHRDLIDSLQPANRLEAKLVEDLARLWWKKARGERAQTGVQLRDVERLQFERLRELHEVNRQALEENEVREVGLLRAKNCEEKFEEARDLLELLIARVERRNGCRDEDVETALWALYGKNPTWRGGTVQSLFQELREAEQTTPVVGSIPGEWPVEAPPESPGFSVHAYLLQLLLAEVWDLTAEHKLYLREHVEISPATRDSRWTWMLRMDNSLDRQIERKLNTLLKVQSLRAAPSRAARNLSRWNREGGSRGKPGRCRPLEKPARGRQTSARRKNVAGASSPASRKKRR